MNRQELSKLGCDRIPHPNWFLTSFHYGSKSSPFLLTIATVLGLGFIAVLMFILTIPATMEVVVTPASASLLRTGEIRTVPKETIEDWARRAVMTFETYDNSTFTDAFARATESVHPSFREKFISEMGSRRAQFESLWLSRFVSPGIPLVISKGNGRYQVLVPYEQIEYTGRTRKERVAASTSDRVTALELIQDMPSDRNSDGLWLIGRTWMTREEWKAGKNAPLWEDDGRDSIDRKSLKK